MEMIDLDKGLDIEKIKEISKIKEEPKWMLDFRIKAFNKFKNTPNPSFGPELKINFDDINYYHTISNEVYKDWKCVPNSARNTFDKLGLIDAEAKYLDGAHAQYDSGSIIVI